jgi:hypothetical protein
MQRCYVLTISYIRTHDIVLDITMALQVDVRHICHLWNEVALIPFVCGPIYALT